MGLPPLATDDRDKWGMSWAFQARHEVTTVSAHRGRVLAAGDALHALRPARPGWSQTALPRDVGYVELVAQEPCAPWRHGLAWGHSVGMCIGNEGTGRLVPVTPEGEVLTATHLAWGRYGGRSTLHVLWNNGMFGRLSPQPGQDETPELPPIDALAYDDNGVLAMVSWDERRVYVTADGVTLDSCSIEAAAASYGGSPEELEGPFHLAVAGSAVALSIGALGAFVCRDIRAGRFERCQALSLAGPLAFEGSSADAPLFGAVSADDCAAVVRVDAFGRATRIGDVTAPPGWPAPSFSAIAWDTSRRMLWCASPDFGLMAYTRPPT